MLAITASASSWSVKLSLSVGVLLTLVLHTQIEPSSVAQIQQRGASVVDDFNRYFLKNSAKTSARIEFKQAEILDTDHTQPGWAG